MILYVIRLAYLRLAYMDMIVQNNTSKYILYNATLCPIGRVHSFIHSFIHLHSSNYLSSVESWGIYLFIFICPNHLFSVDIFIYLIDCEMTIRYEEYGRFLQKNLI